MKNGKRNINEAQHENNIVILVCGNSGVGKRSIINEWKKKLKYLSEEVKLFYKIYKFSFEHQIDINFIPLTLEIRVLNGNKNFI